MAALQRKIKQLPSLPEGFDVMELQFIAQVMGVYRSQVKQMLGVPYKTEFVKRGKRLDEKLTQKQRREALNSAFAITTSQQRKHGYLAPTPDASEPFPRVPSMRSVRRVAERLEDPNEAYDTIMFYEDTLAMARKPKSKDKRKRKMKRNGTMNYTIFKDDNDPDWLIISLVPTGVDINSTYYSEIIDDYEPHEIDEAVLEQIKSGIKTAFEAAANLDVGQPIVSFVLPDDESHIASTVDGTETSDNPIITMGPVQYESEAALEAFETILHELGHVYLRRMGKEYEPQEEAIVERYAMSEGRGKWILDQYLNDAPKRKNPKSKDTGIRIKRDRWGTVATTYYYYLEYKDGYIDIDGQSRWNKKKDLVAKLKSLGFIVKNNNQVFKKSNSTATFMEN